MSQPNDLTLVSRHVLPRRKAVLLAVPLGVLFGVLNLYLDLDFTLSWALAGQLLLALVSVVLVHEWVHGTVARILGHRPLYGVKPPLVYVTFDTKIPS